MYTVQRNLTARQAKTRAHDTSAEARIATTVFAVEIHDEQQRCSVSDIRTGNSAAVNKFEAGEKKTEQPYWNANLLSQGVFHAFDCVRRSNKLLVARATLRKNIYLQ